MSHHVQSTQTYAKVLGILLVLTGVTVLAAQFDFGPATTVIAMGIASVKAYFVAAIFMNLKFSGKLNVAVLGSALFFLIILFAFSEIDILTRVPVEGVLNLPVDGVL